MKASSRCFEAVAKLRTEREVELVVIGAPARVAGSTRRSERLGLGEVVR